MPNILIYIVAAFVGVTAVVFVLVRYLEMTGVFFPSREVTVNPSVMGLPWEDVYFKSRDNVRLNGWFLRNAAAKATLLFAHGNAGNISDRLFKIKFFYDLGLNVFIFDYRGYGKSEGRPTEAGIYWDAQGAYDYLQSRPDADMGKIILYGASIGGTVAIDLAGRRNAALLVVESSITNARDMAAIFYPFVPFFMLNLKFDSLNKVKQLSVPKLFIHSPHDRVVPYAIGQKLFLAAAAPKEFLMTHADHNDGSIATEPSAAQEFIRILKTKDLI